MIFGVSASQVGVADVTRSMNSLVRGSRKKVTLPSQCLYLFFSKYLPKSCNINLHDISGWAPFDIIKRFNELILGEDSVRGSKKTL